jgi:hypothetical protein
MAVTLPPGWTNFQGGAVDPELCDQGTPPTIIAPATISCEDPETLLSAAGGVAPFTWSTTEGLIFAIGPRTATLQLNVFPSGATVDCGPPIGLMDASIAYIRFGKAPFNSKTGFAEPCARLSEGNSHGALVFNCKDEMRGGTVPEFFGDTEVTEEMVPMICEQIDRAESEDAHDCGLPWCTGAGYEICGGSKGPSLFFGSPTEYMIANPGAGASLDLRTEAMKSAGCAPCSLLKGGTIVVTATDALGNQEIFLIAVI